MTFAMTPFDGKYMTSYMMAIAICAFTDLSKQPTEKFDLDILGQDQRVQFAMV